MFFILFSIEQQYITKKNSNFNNADFDNVSDSLIQYSTHLYKNKICNTTYQHIKELIKHISSILLCNTKFQNNILYLSGCTKTYTIKICKLCCSSTLFQIAQDSIEHIEESDFLDADDSNKKDKNFHDFYRFCDILIQYFQSNTERSLHRITKIVNQFIDSNTLQIDAKISAQIILELLKKSIRDHKINMSFDTLKKQLIINDTIITYKLLENNKNLHIFNSQTYTTLINDTGKGKKLLPLMLQKIQKILSINIRSSHCNIMTDFSQQIDLYIYNEIKKVKQIKQNIHHIKNNNSGLNDRNTDSISSLSNKNNSNISFLSQNDNISSFLNPNDSNISFSNNNNSNSSFLSQNDNISSFLNPNDSNISFSNSNNSNSSFLSQNIHHHQKHSNHQYSNQLSINTNLSNNVLKNKKSGKLVNAMQYLLSPLKKFKKTQHKKNNSLQIPHRTNYSKFYCFKDQHDKSENKNQPQILEKNDQNYTFQSIHQSLDQNNCTLNNHNKINSLTTSNPDDNLIDYHQTQTLYKKNNQNNKLTKNKNLEYASYAILISLIIIVTITPIYLYIKYQQ